MNVTRRILKNFRKFTDSKLLTFAQNVLTCTSASQVLANPTPTMAVLSDAIINYSTLLGLAVNKDRIQVSLKNEARNTLLDLLDQLLDFVTLTAQGDEVVLTSSGFDLNNFPVSAKVKTPTNFELSDTGNPGEVRSSCDGQEAGKSFVHEISVDPITEETIWDSRTLTIRSNVFEGLTKGKTYWFRIAVIGTNGQRMYSNSLSRIVQ